MAQQRALARRPDAGDFLQAGLADVLLASGAMRAHREAMGLVPQPLDEIEHGVTRRQLERLSSWHEEGLAPGVAVRSFGDRDHRHVADTKRGQGFLRRAELTLSAIDQ